MIIPVPGFGELGQTVRGMFLDRKAFRRRFPTGEVVPIKSHGRPIHNVSYVFRGILKTIANHDCPP